MLMSKQWNLWPDYFQDNFLYRNYVCDVIYEISVWDWKLLRILFPIDNNNILTSLIINLLDIYITSMRLLLYILPAWDYCYLCNFRSFDVPDGRQQCPNNQLYVSVHMLWRPKYFLLIAKRLEPTRGTSMRMPPGQQRWRPLSCLYMRRSGKVFF